jgi:hypothetical protein
MAVDDNRHDLHTSARARTPKRRLASAFGSRLQALGPCRVRVSRSARGADSAAAQVTSHFAPKALSAALSGTPSRIVSASSVKNGHEDALPSGSVRDVDEAMAIGKSKLGPSLRTSAGARLMVIRCPYGQRNPLLQMAEVTRSLLSLTAVTTPEPNCPTSLLVGPSASAYPRLSPRTSAGGPVRTASLRWLPTNPPLQM